MSMLRQIIPTIALCAALLAPCLAAAQAVAPLAQPSVSADAPAGVGEKAAEYILGPEDVIEFQVVGTSDKARTRIYTDGTIQTNLIGQLPASGRTPRELASDIAKALKAGGYYAEPVVDVDVVSYASRYVTVLGAVSQPGLVPINRAYHLSEILARVGGLRGDAADYLVVRQEDGVEKRYQIDQLAVGTADQDPVVSAGDKIYSPVADVFYLSGQVKSPGPYPLKSNTTVGQAIAMAGGLTESGSDKKVKVRRAGKQQKLSPDALVEPDDVLTVGERLF